MKMKRRSAKATLELIEDGMVVGLGGGETIGYKFVAKNPHACVWDESHISLDIYLEKNI